MPNAVRQHLDRVDAAAHPHTEPGERRVQVCLGLRVHARARRLPTQQHHLELRVPLGDLRGGLDTGQAAAADHDGPAVEPGQPFGEEGGVLRAVEGVGVAVHAGDGRSVRDAAQAVDQGVVGQDLAVVDPDGLRPGVHGGDPAADEGGAGAVQQRRDVHPPSATTRNLQALIGMLRKETDGTTDAVGRRPGAVLPRRPRARPRSSSPGHLSGGVHDRLRSQAPEGLLEPTTKSSVSRPRADEHPVPDGPCWWS